MIVTIVIFDVAVELYQARPSQRGAIGKRVQHDMLSEPNLNTVGVSAKNTSSNAMCKGPRSLALA